MTEIDTPQIYLISPPSFELPLFADQLARVLDGEAIACLRLSLASQDEDMIARTADQLRDICHARDVALVISQHYRLVNRLGLDGCHLEDGPKQLRDVRAELGSEAIIGSYCNNSKHLGISSGEAGADYVAFGPTDVSGLGDGEIAEAALFQWWSEMIEVPVVAEGGLTVETITKLAPITDFFGIGTEIWGQTDPLGALKGLLRPMR